MALAQKKNKRTTRTKRRVTRKTETPALDTRQIVMRIDAMIRELEAMRRQLTIAAVTPGAENLVERLFGAAGQGTWDEYDMSLAWKRFSERVLR